MKELIRDIELEDFMEALNDASNISESDVLELLCEAILCRRNRIVGYLVNQQIDVNKSPASNVTWFPIHIAIEEMNLEAVELIIKANGNINLADGSGTTPLHHAVDIEADSAWQKQVEPVPIISKYLLENGADANLANDEGRTAIDMARDYEYQAFLDLLKRD